MDRSKLTTTGPVHLGTALTVLLADWLVLGVNMTTDFGDLALVTACGAVLAAGAVFAIERWLSLTSSSTATGKALLAAMVVALPTPLAGSLFAAVMLAWALVGTFGRHRTT